MQSEQPTLPCQCESEVPVELMTVSSILNSTVCRRQGPWTLSGERRAQNDGQRACHLCVEHSSMSCKDVGNHPRECAEAVVSEHGYYRGREPCGERTSRSRFLVAELVHALPRQQRKDVRRRSGRADGPGLLESSWPDEGKVRGLQVARHTVPFLATLFVERPGPRPVFS